MSGTGQVIAVIVVGAIFLVRLTVAMHQARADARAAARRADRDGQR